MQIVYISNAVLPSRSANSIHVMKMCQAFARNGHDVTLIFPDSLNLEERGVDDIFSFYGVDECFKLSKVQWCPLWLKTFFSNKLAQNILFVIKRVIYPLIAAGNARSFKPELIYSRFLPGCYWASRSETSIVFEHHAPASEFPMMSRMMFKKLIQQTNFKRLVVISKPLLLYYKEKFCLLNNRLLLAPDGADEIVDVISTELKQSHIFNVGYTGHLYSGRGIELIEQLAQKLPDIGFHIIGGKEPLLSKWKAISKFYSNLHLYGFISPRDISGYLVCMDVLLAPYQRCVNTGTGRNTVDRMSPLKLFEYMATGKPMICSDLPVLHEVLEDKVNALFCNPDSVDEWVEAIDKLKNSKELSLRIGNKAREIFLEKYTWKIRAENVLNGIIG